MSMKTGIAPLICGCLLGSGLIAPSPEPDAFAVSRPEGESAESAGSYRLQPGDVIEIKFFYNPELNEKLEIGPDGEISLQLLNEIKAGGLTREQLRSTIQQGYSGVLKVPEVSVIVRSFVGQRVFVGGEVNAPGLFPLEGRTSILEAIVRAGGFTDRARRSTVLLIRKSPENRPICSTWDLERLLSGEQSGEVEVLRPFDVIFVPKSRIANINVFVDQYIRRVIPIHFAVGFSFLSNTILP
jgi:protein involved in polysaccharide export with SLBB domain